MCRVEVTGGRSAARMCMYYQREYDVDHRGALLERESGGRIYDIIGAWGAEPKSRGARVRQEGSGVACAEHR